ncbi:predicted protein [Naegleria gruberi]|uniref:Predicted protein n=1 Tax=Naegleria gruberi TaxID=5762 RepID=D2VJY4_NAEGR|nr:uncharacterized protein NAEGRDRAFT_50168 [Naegleria gruberi]EFC42850.1 predicted protein [Naegleria gruberi]|eukprot:XP_002675594.1 predicted protein [Naegleria gruberi strain NEG-M]
MDSELKPPPIYDTTSTPSTANINNSSDAISTNSSNSSTSTTTLEAEKSNYLEQFSCPSKLIEPPPLESLKYSFEKEDTNTSSTLAKSASDGALSTTSSSNISTNNNQTLQQPEHQDLASTTIPQEKSSSASHIRTSSITSSSQVSLSKVTNNTDHVQYLFNPKDFKVVGNRIEKIVDKSYSSTFLDTPIGTTFTGKIKLKVRILAFQTWLAVGVTSSEIVEKQIFNLSPYHRNGSYLYSPNGYVWNYQKEDKTKYDQVKHKCDVGDTIIMEICTEQKELTFYKNELKIMTIPNISLPVYPAFVAYGLEQMEMLNFHHQPIELPKFIIPGAGFFVDKQKVSKTTDANYASVFISKLLDGSEKVYKWKIKIVNLNTWLGFGVVMNSIPEKHIHSLSPYDDHCMYMMSANGFIWNPSQSGSKKYKHVYSKNIEPGDVITIKLNAAKKKLQFYKGNSKIASIRDIKLPVYPAIMMYGHESIEFSWTS